MRRLVLVSEAALAAVLFCGCVSIEEHELVRKQLAVEQALVREQDAEARALKQAVRKQLGEIRSLKLKRDELRDRLAAAGKLVPAVADVAREAWATEPVRAGTVRFVPGSQKLSEGDRERLGAMVRGIVSRGYSAILVEGHSDPTPLGEQSPFQSNMQLSAVRALAVYHAIIDLPGVEKERVRVVAHGEFRPEPGKKRSDRRVEVRYVPEAKKRQ